MNEVHCAKSPQSMCHVQANPQHEGTANLFWSMTQTPARSFFSLLILKPTKKCWKNNFPQPQGVNPVAHTKMTRNLLLHCVPTVNITLEFKHFWLSFVKSKLQQKKLPAISILQSCIKKIPILTALMSSSFKGPGVLQGTSRQQRREKWSPWAPPGQPFQLAEGRKEHFAKALLQGEARKAPQVQSRERSEEREVKGEPWGCWEEAENRTGEGEEQRLYSVTDTGMCTERDEDNFQRFSCNPHSIPQKGTYPRWFQLQT